jgi:hypothetical protein
MGIPVIDDSCFPIILVRYPRLNSEAELEVYLEKLESSVYKRGRFAGIADIDLVTRAPLCRRLLVGSGVSEPLLSDAR